MKKIFLILFVIGLYSNFPAQLDRSKPPLPGPAPEIKIGDYSKFELQNGLKVFVVENHKFPTVSLSLTLDLDPILEGKDAGYTNIAGQLLRTGTKNRTKDKLDEEIDFIGAQLNTYAGGVYASSLKKHLPTLLELMSDVIINPVFKQEEFDKIKKQTLSGLQAAKDEPSVIADRIVQTLYFGKQHPYGEFETEESINNITLDKCTEFYNTYFKPNVGYLAVVGDVTKKEIEPLIKKYLANWKKSEVKKYKYQKPVLPSSNIVAIVDRPNAVQSTIRMGYPVDLLIGSEDVRKASITNTILGGGVFRLFENLREKHAFTYGAYSSLTPDELVGRFTAFAEVRNRATDSAITEVLFEMKRIKEEKVGDTELQKAKNYSSGSFAISLEDPATVARFATNIERYKLPKNYYKDYLKNIAAVTRDDVLKMAQKYIQPDNSYIVVVGNASEVADKLKKFNPESKVNFYDIYGNIYDPNVKNIPAGASAESVIENYINAIGGRDNISKATNRTMIMTGNVQGMTLNLTIYQKEPDKLLQVVSAGGMEQKLIINGNKGISISPMGKNEITGDMLEELKVDANMNAVLDYSKSGIKTILVGIEKQSGKDLYKIEMQLPGGKKYFDYYDPETNLKVKQVKSITSPMGQAEQTFEFSDYQDVDGVKYPFKIKQAMGSQNIEVTITSFKVNQNLDDKLFEIEK
jgi:predicted Zn-dependent peptidase